MYAVCVFLKKDFVFVVMWNDLFTALKRYFLLKMCILSSCVLLKGIYSQPFVCLWLGGGGRRTMASNIVLGVCVWIPPPPLQWRSKFEYVANCKWVSKFWLDRIECVAVADYACAWCFADGTPSATSRLLCRLDIPLCQMHEDGQLGQVALSIFIFNPSIHSRVPFISQSSQSTSNSLYLLFGYWQSSVPPFLPLFGGVGVGTGQFGSLDFESKPKNVISVQKQKTHLFICWMGMCLLPACVKISSLWCFITSSLHSRALFYYFMQVGSTNYTE